jgi:hypothetical protein
MLLFKIRFCFRKNSKTKKTNTFWAKSASLMKIFSFENILKSLVGNNLVGNESIVFMYEYLAVTED